MARPRLIRLSDGGEITLKNCSPETYETVKALVLGEAKDEPEEATPPAHHLEYVGIGTFVKKDGAGVVVLKFNPDTKEAIVEEVRPCRNQTTASTEFKILAVKKKII